MKKTAITLIILALIAGGCKLKITSANLPTTSSQIDTLNIQQELTQEEIDQNLLRLLEQQKFNSYPTVSAEEIARIAPIIKKWTDFYSLDFAQARFIGKDNICLDCPPDTSSVYYNKYTPEQNTSQLIEMFYSPDKQRYIDIGILCENINGKYYDTGDYDDSQAVYFTDRQLKHNHNLLYFGISARIETVFWKNNDVFILVGQGDFGEGITYFFVYEYNIPNQTIFQYDMLVPYLVENSYREQVYKEKGIIENYEEYKKLKSQ